MPRAVRPVGERVRDLIKEGLLEIVWNFLGVFRCLDFKCEDRRLRFVTCLLTVGRAAVPAIRCAPRGFGAPEWRARRPALLVLLTGLRNFKHFWLAIGFSKQRPSRFRILY